MQERSHGPTTLRTVRAEKEMHDLHMKREALRRHGGAGFSTRSYSQGEILRGVLGPEKRSLLKDGIDAGVIADAASVKRRAEYRNSKGDVRSAVVDGRRRIVGHGAVFGKLSEPLRIGNKMMRERVMPGAFEKSLRSLPDVRALINHDPSLLLARLLASTLQLNTDDHGLRYQIDPPNVSYCNDLLVSLERGDIDQSSFGFYTVQDDFVEDEAGGLIRQLREVDLFDVSVCTFPAYPDSSSVAERMNNCTHKTDIIVCRHIAEQGADIEVLLVADNGHTDFALCLNCGELEQTDEKLFVSTCIDCAGQIGIPVRMPTGGRWQLGKLQGSVN